MKIGSPVSRYKLKIKSSARVLDVGSGHNPHPRANVIVDKFVDNNYHRASGIKVLNKQEFVNADGENLPFRDKEFDYVICNHVLEHVDNPVKFLSELSRVGKMGYLETPSLIGEYLIPKESHKWLILEINNEMVLVDKSLVGFQSSHDFGKVFQDYLRKHSIGHKIMQRTHSQLLTVNHEWKDSIDHIINPTDERLLSFFKEPWESQHYNSIMPQRGMFSELMNASYATFDIFRSVIQSRLFK